MAGSRRFIDGRNHRDRRRLRVRPSVDIVRELLAAGARVAPAVPWRDDGSETAVTPVQEALSQRRYDIVGVIADAQPDALSARDCHGLTPLQWCAMGYLDDAVPAAEALLALGCPLHDEGSVRVAARVFLSRTAAAQMLRTLERHARWLARRRWIAAFVLGGV